MHRKIGTFTTLTLFVLGQHFCPLLAQENTSAPPVAMIPRLPVTTGWLGNTLLRGGQADWSDKSQTYLQIYTSDMAVSDDGRVFCTTTWEEGGRAPGIYHEGDALAHIPSLGISSGESVAVTAHWLAYGQEGKIAVFSRNPAGEHEPGSGRHITFATGKDAPMVTGLAIDEAKDRIYAADKSGQVRVFTMSTSKPIEGAGFRAVRPGQMRLDAEGNLWLIEKPLESEFEVIAAAPFGSEPTEMRGKLRVVADAVSVAGEETYFQAKGPEGSIGLEFPSAEPLRLLRFSGAGWGSEMAGARVQGSTAGRDGPWTDLNKIAVEPRGWPETWLPLDGRAWGAIRIVGGKIGLRGLTASRRTEPQPGRVLRFSPDGKLLGTITDVAEPLGLACDLKNNRVLISDNGPAQQVVAFREQAGAWKLDASFGKSGRLGQAGGLSGAKGELGPLRFELARGLGLDASGNLYVFSVGASGHSQSRLESYQPDGTLRWRLNGMAFLDSADLDPATPDEAWSNTMRYRRDLQGTDGDGWRAVATTIDKARFPDDPRLHDMAGQVLGVRRIDGKRFLFTTTQGGDPVSVFRFENDASNTAIPCAFLSGRHQTKAWPPYQPAGGGAWLWRDANGDGQFDATEFEKVAELTMSPFTVNARGDLWSAANGQIQCLSAEEKLDTHGIPVWSLAKRANYKVPALFADGGEVRRLAPAPDGETVFGFGFARDLTNRIGHNHPLGAQAVRLRRQGDQLMETHRAVLPYDVDLAGAAHDQGYVVTAAGDYVFIGYEQRMTVLVLRASDLGVVGRIDIGPQSQTPIFDGPPELIVARRGEDYELFMPQYTGNATTVLTWKPADKIWLPPPADVQAKRVEKVVELSWKAATGTTGWNIERRTLELTGWSAWSKVGTAEAPNTAWRDSPVSARAAAYRVRALGLKGATSDWSKSSYVR